MRYELLKTAASQRLVGVAKVPSITGITRLETQPTAINLQAGLAAPLADPLWMLARQWQFNEFQGEDAGTPLRLSFQVQGTKIDAFRAGADPNAVWQPIADHDVPIETRVEAEAAWSTHPRLRGEAGLHALRMASAPVRAALVAAYPFTLAAPTDFAFVSALQQRRRNMFKGQCKTERTLRQNVIALKHYRFGQQAQR